MYNTRAFFSNMILIEAKNRIESLGEGPCPNEYRTFSLKDIIAKNRHIGSFKMWVMILNYMRLSMHDKRKIDLSNIGKFWTLYHERKDYSVINIDVALKVFEEKRLITIEQSCDTIILTQSMSEKGIRHIFNNYIKLHDPGIILFIADKYKMGNLQIGWFSLPEKYINVFPDRIYELALRRILEYNRHSMEINFVEIENVYKSKRWGQLLEDLIFYKFIIRIPEKHPQLNEIKNLPIEIRIESSKEDELEYKMNSVDRYNHGILDSRDIALIKEKKIDISEIAGYTNDYYSVFSDLEIYKIFNEEHVRSNVPIILHTAILGKIKRINMFGNLYYFPGNVPRFINDYNVTISNTKLYDSFKCFLELSMLDIIDSN